MAKLLDVKQASDPLQLKNRQLPLVVDDDKVMILQLSHSCEYCQDPKGKMGADGRCNNNSQTSRKEKHILEDTSILKKRPWSEEQFFKQYTKLSQEEALAATVVPAKTLFNRINQVVECVGCRRSVERLFTLLQDSDYPCMEPLVVTSTGFLTVFMNYSLQPKVLNTLFSQHKTSLTDMLELIPKYKKSGRCVLHCMDRVRCRSSSQSWIDMWEKMKFSCKDSVTDINIEQLLITLDTYLRKHRFCHECKNKVHRAYNILVGNINIDPSKEKGYVAALYAGINKKGTYVKVNTDSEFVMNLIARAEPELQGRDSLFLSRERHAKTLEIAQEEVLTCVGIFLYERLQRIFSRMKEEEQSFDILFHLGLDVIRNNFELAIEEKQGFSKFEKLCEELQKQEIIDKAKKEKRSKKKKNKKRNEEFKENYLCEEETSCDDCEINRIPLQNNSQATSSNLLPTIHSTSFKESNGTLREESSDENWKVAGHPNGGRKVAHRSERSCSEGKETVFVPFLQNSVQHSFPNHYECSASIDSLASRCSQCSRDGGYCSAQCSSGSSRDSSEVACGDGFCSHTDDYENGIHHELLIKPARECHSDSDIRCHSHSPSSKHCNTYAPSLTEMLDDSSCEADEIPEAEVQAWHARLGAMKQKRAELRQTLRQRFQQLCHRKSLSAINGNINSDDLNGTIQGPSTLRCSGLFPVN